MTNEQILQKSIEKAIRNGYRGLIKRLNAESILDINASVAGTIAAYKQDIEKINWYYPIIFSHDFAKAFWGEKGTGITMACLCDKEPYEYMEWMMHLQQMVLEEEPLKYLEKFL